MRVAVYDNLANNGVNHVRGLRRVGVDAHVVPDPFDEFAMSDPRWEELDLELPTDGLLRSALPETELPDWVRLPPKSLHPSRAAVVSAARRAPFALVRAARVGGYSGLGYAGQREWLIGTFREFDCVLGFGLGPALAGLAGVPCVAHTWGGDITLVPFYDENPEASRSEVALARLQRMGLARASKVFLAEPRYWASARRLGLERKAELLPLVVDTERYSPGADSELRSRLAPAGTTLVFMPARQDWRWKGSDRFLRAVARLDADQRQRMLVVCSGWGVDIARSRRLAAELGILDNVEFLPHALSKFRLIRYLRAADIVADQFVLGSLGGSALEAMSCGRPLVTSLDQELFRAEFGEVAPVVACSQPEEIARALGELLSNPARRDELGALGREYVGRHHGDRVAERAAEALAEAARVQPAGD